jgi:MFS family permease
MSAAIAHESWVDYMGHPSDGLTGAVSVPAKRVSRKPKHWQVVSVYIAGEAIGALTQTFIGDKLGRVRFMQLMCVIVTIGTVIQTAAVNIGMFLAGRVLAGYSVG